MTTVSLATWLGYALLAKDANRTVFLPGPTTHGHYQIELSCSECHTKSFDSVDMNSCVRCHGAELKQANDSHPVAKFDDPRNLPLLNVLNAKNCITCHREHKPRETGLMGVTMPTDVCFQCHKEIEKERPSHQNLSFSSCSTSGCHNYHDNRALYEDFLADHLNEPALRPLSERSNEIVARAASLHQKSTRPLTATSADAPAGKGEGLSIHNDWAASAHARSGINCTDCHASGRKDTAGWIEKPDHESCRKCHESEVKGWTSGRHGMRLAAKLTPMTPGEARLPMKHSSAHENLSCSSCHTSHRYDTAQAAASACLKCHDDGHSRAYFDSAHGRSWSQELAGTIAPGMGVSCATCHMPEVREKNDDGVWIARIEHNQNDNLRPNEKMVRGVCLKCHGLGFSLDALADPVLIQKNFSTQPTVHVESMKWAERRAQEKRERSKQKDRKKEEDQ